MTSKHRRYYTPDEVALIKKYAGTKTVEELSLILGRTKQSIKSYCYKKKISLIKRGENHHESKLSNLQREMVMALSHAGFSDSEIHQAAFSHVSRSCIYKYCVRN